MLYSRKKNCASRDKKKKKFNSCVVRKTFSERNKNHSSPFKLNGWSLISMTSHSGLETWKRTLYKLKCAWNS